MTNDVSSSFHWSFFFWFLEELNGEDTLLMGLTLVIQCFFGELPFFVASQEVIDFIGHSNSIVVVLVAFAVRYACYGFFITSKSVAYYVLIVELLQGPSIGLFYCVMASIAQHYALKGSQLIAGAHDKDVKCKTFATMQGNHHIPVAYLI